MKNKRWFGVIALIAVTALAMIACEGPMGPQGLQGLQGVQGEQGGAGTQGDQGDAPTVAVDPETGNWTINGEDTGIPATGSQGGQGLQGNDGLNSYLVIFNATGGRPRFDMVGVTHGNTVAQPADPTRTDAIFTGWYTDTTIDASQWDFDAPITTNTTLYARWIITAIGGVAPYLASQTGTAENPIVLPLQIDLGTMQDAGSGWMQLLDAIASADQFVTLDLSACTMTGTTFATGNAPTVTLAGTDKLVSVVLPTGITAFGVNAFRNCTNLTSITIPDSVTSIGNTAFDSCTSLTNITIPNSVTSFGTAVFRNCTSLTSVIMPDNITAISNETFQGCTNLTSITIPDSVTSIGSTAFRDCSSLTSIIIPDGVTSIGQNAFRNCTSLTSIVIPDSITSIGSNVFRNCTSLTNITVGSGNSNYASQDGVLYNKTITQIIAVPGSRSGSFTIPGSVTTIGANAFAECTSLTSITIPNSVTTIGASAFYDCTSLTSITIGNGVTSIGNSIFYGCTSLTSVTCLAETPPTLGTNAFDNTHASLQIKVPAASVTAYQAAANWSDQASRIVEE
ncbi:MAG: leucine-rich repeat protein [Treponema sp.]|nr:leucine-rich repeat protein [Treponema sp.]